MGDPGLLFPRLYDKPTDKKYKWEVVPHFSDMDSKVVKQVLEKTKRSTLISVENEPLEVLKKINEYERIVSSSLHGLIAADAYNIPNWKFSANHKVEGGMYKFEDYASGVEREYIADLNFSDFNLDALESSLDQNFNYFKGLEQKASALESALLECLN